MKIHAMIFTNGVDVSEGYEIAVCGYAMKPSDGFYAAYAFRGKFDEKTYCKKCYDALNRVNKKNSESDRVKKEGRY